MKAINREYLARRLSELSEWADYLHLSVTIDQPFERGKLSLLEALAPGNELAQLRFELRSARYRLANLAANLGLSAPGTDSATPPGSPHPAVSAIPGGGGDVPPRP
ncbi:MAG TPA: hypothetical protein VMU54_10960 [Planctomycetota bacterium]|nr:hypothetical protein [Planctomycetota bacterium]